MSALLVEVYRDALDLILGGTYDIAGATLAVSLLDDTATLLDLDDTGLTYDQSSDTHSVDVVAIASQSWVWDGDTRTDALVPGSAVTWTPAADESFRWAYIYDTANDKPPIAKVTFDGTATVTGDGATTHTLDIAAIVRFRLYSDFDPQPLGGVTRPLILKDTDAVYWRVTAPAGVLTTEVTSETDDTDAFLTSPDTTTWLLVVGTDGSVSASGAGTLDPGDRLFDDTHPCLLPTGDATVIHTLTVDNTGTLSVT